MLVCTSCCMSLYGKNKTPINAVGGADASDKLHNIISYTEQLTSFFSSYSEGAYHTHPIHRCPHLHSPQPHLHYSDEPCGRHSNDSDPCLARTFWEHLTLQQPSHSLQCNTSWTSVLVKYLLQFWHVSL